MTQIGARLVEVNPGSCVVEVPFSDRVSQQHGYFHGGVVGAIADNAGAYAGFTLLPADATILTSEYKISLLAPAQGRWLRSSARVVRSGRTLITCEVRVTVFREELSELCAIAILTAIPRWGQADTPAPPLTGR